MNYANLEWREGQPYSPDFDDIYFSATSGIEETEHVFIQHNQLHQRFSENQDFTIVETGFGSGLNFLLTAHHWLNLSDESNCLYFYSIENRPFTLNDLKRAQQFWPELKYIAEALQQQYQVASQGFHSFSLFNGRIKLVLLIGDIDIMLPQITARVDAWFLDGFAPSLNPQMWNQKVISQIKRLSVEGTTFSTYTAVGDVRRSLITAGFDVTKVSGCGNKRHMLCGKLINMSVDAMQSSQPWFEFKPQIKPNKTVSIIGAGIAGLTTAWFLVKRGFKVEVFDAGNEPGTQASGNPAGMLMPRLSLQDSADAEFYNSAYFFALRSLHQLDDKQICWKQTGGLQLSSNERVKKQILDYPQDKSLVEVVSPDKASELCRLKLTEEAQYFSQAALVFPKKILQKLINTMGDDLTVHINCDVASLCLSEDSWQLKDIDNEIITTTNCLILASSWQTKHFDVCSHLDLLPARGQISLMKSNEISEKLTLPVSFGGYFLPKNNGLHVIGASFKSGDSEVDIRSDESDENFNDMNQYFTDMFNESDLVGSRASVRAVSSDRVPIIGAVPLQSQYVSDYADLHKGKPSHIYPLASYLPGLYVNTGHGARGFCSAFLSAELLTATICNEPLPVSNRVRYALHPGRFLVRSFKKKGHNEI